MTSVRGLGIVVAVALAASINVAQAKLAAVEIVFHRGVVFRMEVRRRDTWRRFLGIEIVVETEIAKEFSVVSYANDCEGPN